MCRGNFEAGEKLELHKIAVVVDGSAGRAARNKHQAKHFIKVYLSQPCDETESIDKN